ncbi:hypothetical protein AAC387_Pa01g0389 [Persea americana]
MVMQGNTGRWETVMQGKIGDDNGFFCVLRGGSDAGKYREMGFAFCVETVMQGDGFNVLRERNGDAGKDWR